MVRVNLPGIAVGAIVLGGLSALALVLLHVRMSRTGDEHFEFLMWNLFLAWIPLVIGLALLVAHRARIAGALLVPGLVSWLLFLPNAPYLVTDYIHLQADSRVPLWFDFLLLGSFSASGVMLGFASVYLVQVVVSERLGAAAGWMLSIAVFALSALGIYIGRVLRLNSWDAVQEPGALVSLAMARLEDPLGNAVLLGTFVVFTTFLVTGYLAIYGAGLAMVRGVRLALGEGRRG